MEANVSLVVVAIKRAPSCGGCDRRESALTKTLHLNNLGSFFTTTGPVYIVIFSIVILVAIVLCLRRLVSSELQITLLYCLLYFIASPAAILCNKFILKDYGFGYPIMVSSLGQLTTFGLAFAVVQCGGEKVDKGRLVPWRTLFLLGAVSALALVLGQYPYLYLTVAFIQMLKAFSPTFIVIFLFCLQVEKPSQRVIFCILGLCVCTAIASAGEVNFSVIGVSFMAAASVSDALHLVLAQLLLKNQKIGVVEMMYYISPICLLWMLPFALFSEIPTALQRGSFVIIREHPWMFAMSGASGFFVNLTSYLLVRRTSALTLKSMTMTRNGALVVFSGVAMGETVTWLELFGYGGLVFFFALYTQTKAREVAAADGMIQLQNCQECENNETCMTAKTTC